VNIFTRESRRIPVPKAKGEKKMALKDLDKGPKFRARTNVSFGKVRPTVMAGEIFQLDDPDLAKKLLAAGTISSDLKGAKEPEVKAGEATHTDPTKPAANVTQNAAETAGAAADKANKG
jgi:hypothetical protein